MTSTSCSNSNFKKHRAPEVRHTLSYWELETVHPMDTRPQSPSKSHGIQAYGDQGQRNTAKGENGYVSPVLIMICFTYNQFYDYGLKWEDTFGDCLYYSCQRRSFITDPNNELQDRHMCTADHSDTLFINIHDPKDPPGGLGRG